MQLLGILWIIAGAVVWAVGWAGGSGRLPRNSWAGIRVQSTMRSDEAWYEAHRVAGPWFQGGGALTAMIGALLLLFAPPPATFDAITIVLVVVLLGTVIGAAAVGIRAAKKVEAD